MSADAPDAAIIDFIARDEPVPTEDEFNQLAGEIFSYQFERNLVYRRFCEGRGRTPENTKRWQEMPAVPTDAFRMADFGCFPAAARVRTFVSSGTTRRDRSRHHLDTLELYEASLRPNFARHLLPDGARLPMLSLTPSARDHPESSLFHMIETVMLQHGVEGSGYFLSRDGSLQTEELTEALEAHAGRGQAVILLGAAFSFVHFLDWCEESGRAFELPPGSRAMETGGYKARSREMPREELLGLLGERLGIPRTHVVNEYGMTELGVQFYDVALRDTAEGRSARDWKSIPHWARVQVLDPETMGLAREGEVGIIEVCDLSNRGSAIRVRTSDLGRATGDGFQVIGRAGGAATRGCSLTLDELIREGRA